MNVCIFGASGTELAEAYYKAAFSLGRLLAENGHTVVFGGGGLGKIAIDYGYYRYKYLVMFVAVIILILLVQLFQSLGTYLARRCDKRLR